jgi:hypothetical protein
MAEIRNPAWKTPEILQLLRSRNAPDWGGESG